MNQVIKFPQEQKPPKTEFRKDGETLVIVQRGTHVNHTVTLDLKDQEKLRRELN